VTDTLTIHDGVVPRCSHGKIILGCPDSDCPEQNAYLADHNRKVDDHYEHQQIDARRLVREWLGLPAESISYPGEP